MRICMLSDYMGFLDEGMRNIAYYLDTGLSTRHQVLHICLKPLANLLKPSFWSNIKKFEPEIIHFIPGSTIKTFMMVEVLKAYCSQAKVVMSALHPVLSPLSQRLVASFHPDLILTQSFEAEQMFTRLGCKTRFMINGVDTGRFAPVSPEVKRRLRRKYNLDESSFIVLHVGHLQRGRNLHSLNQLQRKENVQVLIVGSVSAGAIERHVYQELVGGGCLVWNRYFEQIQEVYALSDCYIFPTVNRRNCVEFPLSIMEAMSCNLPVITTPFGAVPQVFEGGEGLYFASKKEDFVHLLEHISKGEEKVRTREKVLPYSWGNIVHELESIYGEVLDGNL